MVARNYRKLLKPVGSLLNERTLSILYLGAALLLASGFIYVLVFKPPPMTRMGIISVGREGQTVTEMLLVAFDYGIGVVGLYLVYSARRYMHNPRYMVFLFISGALISAFSIVMLLTIHNLK